MYKIYPLTSAGLGSDKLQILLQEWMACEGEWRKSALYKTITERKKTSAYGARVWLTKAQIAQKYNSAELGEQICRAKLADAEASKTQVKKHPDLPDSEDQGLRRLTHLCGAP